ncbi:hypothetical protein PDL73_12345, partial [Bacteroides fragilis]|uniref:hypothetical protein n=1 Tax=Bacteroides fragilis TaxID=817 RepID=UPI0022DF85BA
KNLTWQNPEQLFVAQELINKVKSKCCGIKIKYLNDETERELFTDALKKTVSIYAQEHNTPLDNEQLKELDILCDVDSYIK